MDPRRLDNSNMKSIFNCQPPTSSLNDSGDNNRRRFELEKVSEPTEQLNGIRVNKSVHPDLSEKCGFEISKDDFPELERILPNLSRNSSIYIDINIYVVEDDEQTPQKPQIPKNQEQKPSEITINKKPSIFSQTPPDNEQPKSNKLFIPNIATSVNPRLKLPVPLNTYNNISSDSESSLVDDFQLEKRENCSDDFEYDTEGCFISDLFNKVKRYWNGSYAFCPYTFKKKVKYYNEESGEYLNMESIDYSNKVIPK